MAFDSPRAFTTTIASAASQSSAISLNNNYTHVSLGIPSMASGSDIKILVSDKTDGTFMTLCLAPTVTSAAVAVQIASGLSSSVIPIPGLHHGAMKVQLTTATTDTSYTFTVFGG